VATSAAFSITDFLYPSTVSNVNEYSLFISGLNSVVLIVLISALFEVLTTSIEPIFINLSPRTIPFNAAGEFSSV
ncbi:hypothetical protein D030_1476B, partial [Vibrio parahaemolyticus AQ3810]